MTKNLRTYVCCGLSAALLAVLLLISPFSASAAEKVVARVGDFGITEVDLDEALSLYIPTGGFHASIDRSQKDEYRKDALNDLIEIELLSREAQKRGIKASIEAVEAVIKENIKLFKSEEELKKALEKSDRTLDAFREKIRKNDMVNNLLKELADESRYSDEELKQHYEQNRAKYKQPDALFLYHILISAEPAASENVWQEKKKFAEQLLEKIRGGADFGSIAYQYSEDPYKYKSGELGFVHRGRLVPQELEDAAFGLRKDEVSEVIRTIHGFHILKAGDRKPGETKSLDAMKDRLKKELEKKRFEGKKDALLESLRKEFPVEINLELRDNSDAK